MDDPIDPELAAVFLGILTTFCEAVQRGDMPFVILPNDIKLCVLPRVLRELELESGQTIDLETGHQIMQRTERLFELVLDFQYDGQTLH